MSNEAFKKYLKDVINENIKRLKYITRSFFR